VILFAIFSLSPVSMTRFIPINLISDNASLACFRSLSSIFPSNETKAVVVEAADILYHIKDRGLRMEHQILKALHQTIIILQLESPQTLVQRIQEILNKNLPIL
jgi:hypothetical protein